MVRLCLTYSFAKLGTYPEIEQTPRLTVLPNSSILRMATELGIAPYEAPMNAETFRVL